MDFENCEISFDCVLPSAIFFNEKIEPGAIRLYAMMRNLAKMNGYCYANNHYFAGLLNIGKATIKRWLSSLEEEGFIEIEHVANFEKDSRHIYISDNFKKCLRRLKNEPPVAQNRATRGSKMSHIIEEYPKESEKEEKKVYKEKPTRIARQPAAAAIVLNTKTKKFEGISEEDLKNWQEAFPAVNVRKEIAECQLWAASTPRNNYRKSLNKWMSNVNKNHTTPYVASEKPKPAGDDDLNHNKCLSEKWEGEFSGKGGIHYAILATSSKVTFVMPNEEGYSVDYNQCKMEFLKKCQKARTKMNL